jgi:nucleotide-binding universal stress UspA family protein
MSGDGAGPILLGYDGSEGARAAVEVAGSHLPGREIVAVCFWQPFAQLATRLSVELLELVQDPASVNEREALLAQEIADEGAELARVAGLVAEARAVEASGPVDEAIIACAEELDAPLIVLGSRGRTGIRSLLLGDVAHDVVQRSSTPVLLVPSCRLADRRRRALVSESQPA